MARGKMPSRASKKKVDRRPAITADMSTSEYMKAKAQHKAMDGDYVTGNPGKPTNTPKAKPKKTKAKPVGNSKGKTRGQMPTGARSASTKKKKRTSKGQMGRK